MVSQGVVNTILRCLILLFSLSLMVFACVIMVRLVSSGFNMRCLRINEKRILLRTDNHAININGQGITVLPRKQGWELSDSEKADRSVDSSVEEEGSCRREEEVCDEEGEEEGEVRIVYKNYGTIHYEIRDNSGTVNISRYINYGDIHVHLHDNYGKVRIMIYNGDENGRVFIHCHYNNGHIELFKDSQGTTELKILRTNMGRISEEILKADGRLKGKYTEEEFHATQTIHDHRNVGHRDL